jgi:hypothetical protein
MRDIAVEHIRRNLDNNNALFARLNRPGTISSSGRSFTLPIRTSRD